jgi:hypothetical protein
MWYVGTSRKAMREFLMTDHIKLSENLAYLSRNNRHVLVQKSSGQWVMLNQEAYEIIVSCKGMTFEEASQIAHRKYGGNPEHFEALFNLLIERGILVLEETPPAEEKRSVAEEIRQICRELWKQYPAVRIAMSGTSAMGYVWPKHIGTVEVYGIEIHTVL